MRKFVLIGTIIAILVLPITMVQAAPPPDGPPGLERAIEVKERHAETLLGVPGVVGVGVGHNGHSSPAIIIFTETPRVRGLSTFLEGVPVVTRVSGKFFAQPKPDKPGKPPKPPEEPELSPKDRWPWPVPIGVSTGHPNITAGTIGARVTDGASVYALSNNHVYVDENQAEIGGNVLQPGAYDGGIDPDDSIGTLFDFEPIVFSTSAGNVIDAAIALAFEGALNNATPDDGYGTPKSATAEAQIRMRVKKYGRTTGQTNGRVVAINMTVDVGYGTGVARFVDQIVISPGAFSAGGDSGSLIVVNVKGRDYNKPVGLLFAGSQFYTIANPIGPVLDRFGVTIDGE